MGTLPFSLGPRRTRPEQRLSVVEHLGELRRRVIVVSLTLVVAFLAMYAVHGRLLEFLTLPLPDGQDRLLTLSPTEPFFTSLKVALWGAVVVTLAVLIHQVYSFVIPAVAAQSKRLTVAVVGSLVTLFLAGMAFGYFVVLPFALKFLLGFGGDAFTTELRASEYLGFAMSLTLASGVLFQIPVIMATLAAILPGGDPASMMLLLAPQLLLYGAGMLLAARVGTQAIWRDTDRHED